ncbi:hypothetical protein [Actinomadura madurae]|nr:hypothetical protein [Actinomadura madurae]MCQ0014061.1 hypothetical protein [Actinomadura madurae]
MAGTLRRGGAATAALATAALVAAALTGARAGPTPPRPPGNGPRAPPCTG